MHAHSISNTSRPSLIHPQIHHRRFENRPTMMRTADTGPIVVLYANSLKSKYATQQ